MDSLGIEIPPVIEENLRTIYRGLSFVFAFLVFCIVPPSPMQLFFSVEYTAFRFTIANAVFVWLLSIFYFAMDFTDLGSRISGYKNLPLLLFLVDANFLLWTFCAFLAAATELNRELVVAGSGQRFTLYNYCSQLASLGVQDLDGCPSYPDRMATGAAFTFFMILSLAGSTYISYSTYTNQSGIAGDLDDSLVNGSNTNGTAPDAGGSYQGYTGKDDPRMSSSFSARLAAESSVVSAGSQYHDL